MNLFTSWHWFVTEVVAFLVFDEVILYCSSRCNPPWGEPTKFYRVDWQAYTKWNGWSFWICYEAYYRCRAFGGSLRRGSIVTLRSWNSFDGDLILRRCFQIAKPCCSGFTTYFRRFECIWAWSNQNMELCWYRITASESLIKQQSSWETEYCVSVWLP